MQRHLTFWFDDGSLLVPTSSYIFKIHEPLLTRHSPTCFSWIVVASSSELSHISDYAGLSIPVLNIPHDAGVMPGDFEVLLEHLYHDTPLNHSTQYSRLASLLRISSPTQLHIPSLYSQVCAYLALMFPGGHAPFALRHPEEHLMQALELAMELAIDVETKKAILYSVAATTDFDPTGVYDPAGPQLSDPSKISSAESHLSLRTLRICHRLLSSIISDFTPLLFTVGATSHMECTDVLADRWMSVVISPALADGGVGKPLETLHRMSEWDWKEEGICDSCVQGKKDEWEMEARAVWKKMDGWIAAAEKEFASGAA